MLIFLITSVSAFRTVSFPCANGTKSGHVVVKWRSEGVTEGSPALHLKWQQWEVRWTRTVKMVPDGPQMPSGNMESREAVFTWVPPLCCFHVFLSSDLKVI